MTRNGRNCVIVSNVDKSILDTRKIIYKKAVYVFIAFVFLILVTI